MTSCILPKFGNLITKSYCTVECTVTYSVQRDKMEDAILQILKEVQFHEDGTPYPTTSIA